MRRDAEPNGLASPADGAPPCCVPVPHLVTEDLSLYYGMRCVLRDVSLPIHRGCVTAIVGPSGCGKSSFLQGLNRLTDLIPGCRVEGRVRLDDDDVTHARIDVVALRRRVGMIFQKPTPLPFSIGKNIDFPLRQHGRRNAAERAHLVERALREVGLWDEVKDRLDAPAHQLSGGQQQRLCIARALALDPEVVLFDEPCSALDPLASGTVEDLIASLRGRYTVAIVTHNLAQARRIADHVAVFWMSEDTGRLIEFGSARAIFHAPTTELTASYIRGIRG